MRQRPAIEQVWRDNRSRLVAALNARFHDLDLAEDALAEAVLAAHHDWQPGVPDNAAGWLYRTAIRKGISLLRRQRTRDEKAAQVTRHLELIAHKVPEVPEERLGLFFQCAHPALARDAQTGLILYHLAGMDCARIARAFLTRENTVQQRLKRARDKLKANGIAPGPPPLGRWPDRLPAVLSAIEIIYDQSYADLGADAQIVALAREARALAALLVAMLPGEAEVLGLAAMLELTEARRAARLDGSGDMIPLSLQDPTRWNPAFVQRGAALLQRIGKALPGSVLAPGPYVLRAQIQAVHACGPAMPASQKASELMQLYDALWTLMPGPVVGINRALVMADLRGAEAAKAALFALNEERDLSGFAPWHLVCAEMEGRLGRRAAARQHLQAALALTGGEVERRFIARKLAEHHSA